MCTTPRRYFPARCRDWLRDRQIQRSRADRGCRFRSPAAVGRLSSQNAPAGFGAGRAGTHRQRPPAALLPGARGARRERSGEAARRGEDQVVSAHWRPAVSLTTNCCRRAKRPRQNSSVRRGKVAEEVAEARLGGWVGRAHTREKRGGGARGRLPGEEFPANELGPGALGPHSVEPGGLTRSQQQVHVDGPLLPGLASGRLRGG